MLPTSYIAWANLERLFLLSFFFFPECWHCRYVPLYLTILTLDSSFLLLISLLTHPQPHVYHSPFLHSKLRLADNLVIHHNISLGLQSSGIALLPHTKPWVPHKIIRISILAGKLILEFLLSWMGSLGNPSLQDSHHSYCKASLHNK